MGLLIFESGPGLSNIRFGWGGVGVLVTVGVNVLDLVREGTRVRVGIRVFMGVRVLVGKGPGVLVEVSVGVSVIVLVALGARKSVGTGTRLPVSPGTWVKDGTLVSAGAGF